MPAIEEFINDLNPNDICEHFTIEEADDYVNQIFNDLIIILDELHFKGIDNDELYDSLIEFGIKSKIAKFFDDTINNYCND